MNICIWDVNFRSNHWDVKKAIASVVHYEDEFNPSKYGARRLNFKVELDWVQKYVRNHGTGTLTLPSREVGEVFLRWTQKGENHIQAGGRRLRFGRATGSPPSVLADILDKTPFLDPDMEEQRERKKRELDGVPPLPVDQIQIGTFYRASPGASRDFSVEWEYPNSPAWLWFEYSHRLIRLQIGDSVTDKTASNIVIKLSNIRKLEYNYNGKSFLCFDLLTPAVFEMEDFFPSGNDNKKFRCRVRSPHPGHARISTYCHHMRVVLNEHGDLDVFLKLCAAAEQPCVKALIDASARCFFSQKYMHNVSKWLVTLEKLNWRVAFQIEAILRNGFLHMADLWTHLRQPIDALCREHADDASEVLRRFSQALQPIAPTDPQTALRCFRWILTQISLVTRPSLPSRMFYCHHVCVTPTKLLLEGPFATQTNRVIREWQGYEDNFIRVDLRDEDRLKYSWDSETDGGSFLEERVGGILKDGFELAGRRFEFLAYSSSALREHAVWFLHPFRHGKEWINADNIRASIGTFEEIIHQPSKFAARIAQAFTATDASVRIHTENVEGIEDIGMHTDGVGTISKELGDQIWTKLCDARRDHGMGVIQPSAYQIRYLGYKGVIGVDEQLVGVKMRLRGSMKKFEGHQSGHHADIEIADSFEIPRISHLNRSLIMVLEDRGVKKDSFMTLQNMAVADARTIDDSLVQFKQVLKTHGLGAGHRLGFIIENLMKLGLDLKTCSPERRLDNVFLGRVRRFAITHVLRDIKHGARIPIPQSWLLVGVADEGPAYVAAGYENVYTLPQGKIYACVQTSEASETIWLQGNCTISRSPVVHPGDVQRVRAIGKPPDSQLCLFRNLKNVVVLPSTGMNICYNAPSMGIHFVPGDRSLASGLSGGDLDGDQYSIIFHPSLLPTEEVSPALYEAGGIRENEDERPSTVDDICDFIVEYIHSDVLGLLSDRHLVIADQSKDGTRDKRCIRLAELCSQAVDYPKNGIPVNIRKSPPFLIPYKPDWHAAEVASPRRIDYYESQRALGYLYRAIELEDPTALPSPNTPLSLQAPLTDVISAVLKPLVRKHLENYTDPDGSLSDINKLFQLYVTELTYICQTYTLSRTQDVLLTEEEIVVGTILAKCSQRRWRKERMHAMRTHVQVLVQSTQRELVGGLENASPAKIRSGLLKAWAAWDFSLRHGAEFGANGFGLIALGVIFDCLIKVGGIPNP